MMVDAANRSAFRRAGMSLAAVALLFLPVSSPAQGNRSLPPVELQETGDFGMGARALGMGRVATASLDDATALGYNPAALAQIRRIQLSTGLAHDDVDHALQRSALGETNRTKTRFEHLAFAYPYPTYRGSFVVGFAFHRMADLEQDLFMTGFSVPPSEEPNGFGVVEVEDVIQSGSVNAWTGGFGLDLSPQLAVGASVSYLTGSRTEDIVTARGIPDPSAGGCPGLSPDEYGLFYGCGDPSESALFREQVRRDADLVGYTGSLGFLARFDSGIRLGGTVYLPRWLEYEGSEVYRLEDFLFVTGPSTLLFQDEITLPLSVGGGIAWGHRGLLLALDAKWTDWKQIDYEGDIRGPDRDFAYRSVVALSAGAEYSLRSLPLRFRAGFFTEPIPYDLMAADAELDYDTGSDGQPGTDDDTSEVLRYYPRADIVSDRKFFTLGAGVLIQSGLSVDVAYLHGSWERRSVDSFQEPNGFATREEVTRDRIFLSATLHFE